MDLRITAFPRALLPAAVLFVAGCGTGAPKAPRYPLIEKLAWLDGRWQVRLPTQKGRKGQPESAVEIFQRESESSITAELWLTGNHDSLPWRRYRLEEKGNRLEYSSGVPLVNADEHTYMPFMPDSGTATAALLDAWNDFPQNISYRPIGTDSAIEQMSERTAQGLRKAAFTMVRIRG